MATVHITVTFVLFFVFLVAPCLSWKISDHLHESLAWVKGKQVRTVSGGATCETDTDCHDNGQCIFNATTGNGTCVCDSEHSAADCSYTLKKKLTAFLLAILAGEVGAMRFYLGYVGDGVGKIILVTIPCLLICMAVIVLVITQAAGQGVSAAMESKPLAIGVCIASCAVAIPLIGLGIAGEVAAWVWWLVDWILILENDIDDSNGYPLFDDM